MRVALIYATWPVTPYGATWFKLADSIRAAGLGDALQRAGHEVDEHVLVADGPSATELRGAFELGARVAKTCSGAREAGAFPVILCGSCAVAAIGALAALGGRRAAILWMDAHPDLNTPETSGSGMLDGMALSIALQACWQHLGCNVAGLHPGSMPDVCFFGARDVDPGEAAFIAENKLVIANSTVEACRTLAACDFAYIHLDMDVHDALQVRANQFAVPDGPAVGQVREVLREASTRLPVNILSVTGLDPAAPDASLAIDIAIEHILTVCDSRSAAQC